MAEFNSIWGNLNVNKVEPKEVVTPPADPSTPPAEVKPIEEEVGEEKEVVKPAEGKAPTSKPTEEKEVLEYSEDDLNKTFTILLDEGVIDVNEDEEFDATPQGIADAVALSIRKRVQAELESTPKAVQELYTHIMNGGDPKNFEFTQEILWSEADLEDEEVQREGLKALYLDQGMTEEEAEEEIADIPADKLAKKAELAIGILAKKESELSAEAKAAAEKKNREREAQVLKDKENLSKTIDSLEEMAGFKLDDKKKSGFKDYLFKKNPRTGKTQLESNMAADDRKLKIAFLDYIDYNKSDLEKEIKSDVTKVRSKKLARFTDKNIANSNSSKSVTTKTSVDRGSFNFPTIFGPQTLEIED